MEESGRLPKSAWPYAHLQLGPGRSVLAETLRQIEKRIVMVGTVSWKGQTNTRSIREEEPEHDTRVVSLTN